MTTIYVRCRVSRGFFGNEFYVVVGNSSAFVDHSNVKVDATPDRGKEVDGKVLAYVIQEESEKALVELHWIRLSMLGRIPIKREGIEVDVESYRTKFSTHR